jgi:hypothetical protein
MDDFDLGAFNNMDYHYFNIGSKNATCKSD